MHVLVRAVDGIGLAPVPAAALGADPAPAGLAVVRLHLPEQPPVDFEDIVIGSGLAALGAAIGLEGSRSVLVLGGPAQGQFSHYDGRATVPSSYLGDGGLGNDWHGVIPTGWCNAYDPRDDEAYAALFRRFYLDQLKRVGRRQLLQAFEHLRSLVRLLRGRRSD